MASWNDAPPHDPEAERMVLGALLSGSTSDFLTAQHFYIPGHEHIFMAYQELAAGMERPTQFEVTKYLKKQGLWQGDMREMVIKVAGSWMPADNLPFWTEKLENARKLRVLRTAILQAQNMDAPEALERMEQAIMEAQAQEERQRLFTGAEVAVKAEERLKQRLENPAKVTGLDLGFKLLSEKTHGLQPGDLMLVAAATSHGKSAFAQNVLVNLGVNQKVRVDYLNTEMDEEQVTDRLLAIMAGVPFDRVMSGFVNATEKDVLKEAVKRLKESPLTLTDALPDLTPQKVYTLARRLKRQGSQLLIVDYVGRLEMGLGGKLQEYQILEQIAKGLKRVAQQLKIAVVALAQLHEESGYLAGSKRMKNEADIFVKLLPVEDDKELKEALQGMGLTENDANYVLSLEKNRRGQQGTYIPLYFDKPRLQMWEAHR